MATNMPPPPSPARISISEGNRSKRKAQDSDASTSGIRTFPKDCTSESIERLIDPDDYVIMCIPKALARSLQTFLDKSANTLEGLSLKTPIVNIDDTDEDSAFQPNLSDEFRTTFSTLKSELSSLVSKYKGTDLAKDVKPELLKEFKETRSILSRWFTTGQRLTNKLVRTNTHTNDYIKLGFNFSPIIQDDDLKEEITKKIQALKSTCETLLTDSVVNTARAKNYEATEILNKVLKSDDPDFKFLVAKTYRCIVKGSQSIIHSNPWVKHPPRQHVPQSSDEPRHTGDSRRIPYQQRDRDLHFSHSNEPHSVDDYHREQYNHREIYRREPSIHREDNRRESYRQRDNYPRYNTYHNANTYDRDFAPYDRDYKQVKERYRKPSAQGRQASRSSTFNWV